MVKTYNTLNLLENFSSCERELAKHLIDYLDIETLSETWHEVAK